MEKIEPTFVLKTHDEFKEKTHVYDFQRTGEKNIFAVATYKGLFMLRIDSKSFEITQLNKFFNEPGIPNEIHSVSFVEDNILLVGIIKESKLRVLNYKTGKTNFEIESVAKDKYLQAMVSLNEVLRQDPSLPLRVYETATPSNDFIV